MVGADDDDDEAELAAARRGLFAKEAVAEGASVATVPAPLVLTLARSALPHKHRLDKLARRKPECGAHAQARHAMRRAADAPPPSLHRLPCAALAAALLWEKNAGDASAWAPYIAALPTAVRARPSAAAAPRSSRPGIALLRRARCRA